MIKKIPILPFGKIFNKRSIVYVGNVAHILYQIIIQNKNGIFIAVDNKAISTSILITEIKSIKQKDDTF